MMSHRILCGFISVLFLVPCFVEAEGVSSPPESTEALSTLKKKKSHSNKKKPAPSPPPFVGPPRPPKKEDIAEMLYPDEFGARVSTMVVGLANRIDSFFGAERSDDEKNGSTLRIIPSYTWFEHSKAIAELGVNLNLKLINLETKAKKLEKSIRDEFIESPKGENKSNGKSKTKLIEKPISEEDWHYNFESKLASRPAIYYSGKLRARKNFSDPFFLHHFSFSAGWDTDDGWSQKTSFFSDKAINEYLLYRFVNDINWLITKKLFQTTHGPSLVHTINKYNFVSYNMRVLFGEDKNKLEHLSNTYSINYRHGAPSQRVFIDLIPSYTYSQDSHFNEIKSFELRLEYFFGDL